VVEMSENESGKKASSPSDGWAAEASLNELSPHYRQLAEILCGADLQ